MHPLKDSNFYQRFWRPVCYHCTKEMCEQVFGFEPKSPVWKTRALTVVLYLQLVDEQNLLLLWLPTKAHYFISSKQKNPLTFGLEGLYNSNVIYIYPTSVSSNNAQLPPQIRFGWLQIVCVKDALIVNIYLIFKKSNLISKYATSSHAPVNTSLIKLLLSGTKESNSNFPPGRGVCYHYTNSAYI